MRISIAILAWNEEASIVATLRSVFNQTLIQHSPDHSLELICVANGCTDKTASVARQEIDRQQAESSHNVYARVEVIEIPSKENAWNEFVHRLSSRDSAYLIFLDGDVALAHNEVLQNIVRSLQENAELWLAGGTPVKHIATRRTYNPLHWISLAASSVRRQSPNQFGGCLYGARSDILRRFLLPNVLVGEDCFLGAILSTEFFTTKEPTGRVIRAPNSEVIFEAYLPPFAVYRNLRRRAVELCIDSMLYDVLWKESRLGGPDAGELILRWQAENPHWAAEIVRERIAARGFWVLPRGFFFKWIRRVWKLGGFRRWIYMPLALFATSINLAPAIHANFLVRGGKTKNLWFTTSTQAVAIAAENDSHQH